jgi:hypothetical protein
MSDLPDGCVPLDSSQILWEPFTRLIPDPDYWQDTIEVRWGWGASLTDEEHAEAEKAGDIPHGYTSIRMGLDQAMQLTHDLNRLIADAQDLKHSREGQEKPPKLKEMEETSQKLQEIFDSWPRTRFHHLTCDWHGNELTAEGNCPKCGEHYL